MNKLITAALLTGLVLLTDPAISQPKSLQEIKDYLCKYKWFLRRLEEGDQYYTTPKDLQGSKMVFKSNGKMYTYLPGQNENAVPQSQWTLTSDRLVLTNEQGKKVIYKYKFEDLIGYTLYLTVFDEYANPTYVWEQAERVAEATVVPVLPKKEQTQTSIESIVNDPIPENTGQPQWYMTFTKGLEMGPQTWVKTANFPEKEIDEKWAAGYYVTDLSFGGDNESKFFLTMSHSAEYTDQVWRQRKTLASLNTAFTDIWEKDKGYCITHVTYVGGVWTAFLTKGSRYKLQASFQGTEFPEQKIKEYADKGYHITDFVYGGGWWSVIMSTGSRITSQKWQSYSSWDAAKIKTMQDQGYMLTKVDKANGKWYAVFSRMENLERINYEVRNYLPSPSIKKFWDNGYRIFRTFYIPGVDD